MDERTVFEIPTATSPAPAPPPPRPRSNWLLAALIGALVGALVGGLVTKLLDDDAPTSASVGAPDRPSTVLNQPGNIGQILDKIEPAVVSISTRGFA